MLGSVFRSNPRTFGAFFGLVATCCLTPSSPKTPSTGGEPASTETEATPVAHVIATGDLGPKEFTHATSAALIADLDLGWNVGNSLDVPDGETAWGNPKVSAELMQAVASAGFDLVRIPVTWTPHMGPGPEFVIENSWFERVAEVAGYARAAGLYAIINVHHDGADGFEQVEWITLNDAAGNTTDENNALVRARFARVWAQIAKYFADWGEELLFESMNEIHDGYGPPDARHLAFVNELNQAFVDEVRKSGGNNTQRHLVVPGYNTNIDHTVAGFEKPNDPTPDHLILSVHYYDPYLFALQAKTTMWGKASAEHDDWGQEDFVVQQFDKVKSKFIDHGLPVLIGEYGATNNQGFEDYRRYYMEYVTKAAVDRGMLPVYWDNGGRGSGGENFGLFDRNSGAVLHPKILEAMQRAATQDYELSDVQPAKATQ